MKKNVYLLMREEKEEGKD